MKDEITEGTQAFLENVLDGSSFASDGKGAFDGIEVTLESIEEMGIGPQVEGLNDTISEKMMRNIGGERKRRALKRAPLNNLEEKEHREKQEKSVSLRSAIRQTTILDEIPGMSHEERMALLEGPPMRNIVVASRHGGEVPQSIQSRFPFAEAQLKQLSLNSKLNEVQEQHAFQPQRRQLRQRHHRQPAAVQKVDTPPFTVVPTTAQIPKSGDPIEVAMTFSAVAKFSQPVDPTVTNGDELFSYVSKAIEEENELEEEGVGYIEQIKKRFDDLDDEKADDALSFWENVSGLSVTKVQDENNNSTIVDPIEPSLPTPGTLPTGDENVTKINNETSTTIPSVSPTPYNLSNQSLDEEGVLFSNETESNTTLNPVDDDDNVNIGEPSPEDDGFMKGRQAAAIALGVSAAVIAVILLVTSALYRRWERNQNREESSDEAPNNDCPPEELPPSSPTSPMFRLLRGDSVGLSSSSSASNSFMIAGGVKQSTFQIQEEDNADVRRLKNNAEGKDTKGWLKELKIPPLKTPGQDFSVPPSYRPSLSEHLNRQKSLSSSSSTLTSTHSPPHPAWLSSQDSSSPWWESTTGQDVKTKDAFEGLVKPVKSRVTKWNSDESIKETASSRRKRREEEEDFLFGNATDISISLIFSDENLERAEICMSSSGSSESKLKRLGSLGFWRTSSKKSRSSSSSSPEGGNALSRQDGDNEEEENSLTTRMRSFFDRSTKKSKLPASTDIYEEDISNPNTLTTTCSAQYWEEKEEHDISISNQKEIGVDHMDYIEESLHESIVGIGEEASNRHDNESKRAEAKSSLAIPATTTSSNPTATTGIDNDFILQSVYHLEQQNKRPAMDVDNRSDFGSEDDWHCDMPSLTDQFDLRDESMSSKSTGSKGGSMNYQHKQPNQQQYQQYDNGIMWMIRPTSEKGINENPLETLEEGTNEESGSSQNPVSVPLSSHSVAFGDDGDDREINSPSPNPSDHSSRVISHRLVSEEPAADQTAQASAGSLTHLSRMSSNELGSQSSSSKATKLSELHATIDELFCDLSSKTSVHRPRQKAVPDISENNRLSDFSHHESVLPADRRAQREDEETLLDQNPSSVLGRTSAIEGNDREAEMVTILDDPNEEELEEEVMALMPSARSRSMESKVEYDDVHTRNVLDYSSRFVPS